MEWKVSCSVEKNWKRRKKNIEFSLEVSENECRDLIGRDWKSKEEECEKLVVRNWKFIKKKNTRVSQKKNRNIEI